MAVDLAFGNHRASIEPRGAALRRLVLDGHDVVPTWEPGIMAPFYAGAVLAPWPNRVFGATWTHHGREHHLDTNELGTANALHGYLSGTLHHVDESHVDESHVDESRVDESRPSRTTLLAKVHPRPGYLFDLDVRTSYELDVDGLTVTIVVENLTADPAPVALGSHPFVAIPGLGRSDETTLSVPASLIRSADGSWTEPSTSLDLRGGVLVSQLRVDDCYGGIERDQGGRITATIDTPAGTLTLWAAEPFGWLQVFTTDGFPGVEDRALAVEPMTAPPNALQSGEGLSWLAPGAELRAQWGLCLGLAPGIT